MTIRSTTVGIWEVLIENIKSRHVIGPLGSFTLKMYSVVVSEEVTWLLSSSAVMQGKSHASMLERVGGPGRGPTPQSGQILQASATLISRGRAA